LFSLVPIADGRVVAAGGCRGFDASFGCAGNTTFTDYYDPVADLWTEGPPLPIGVDGYAAAPLGDGALVVGGYGQSTFQFATYVLDPAADAWISVGVTGYEHLLSPIAVLPTGELLLTGSWGTAYSLSDITDTAEVFDPVSETWSTLPSMRASRGAHTATVLDDGRVLLASGLGELGSTQVLNATGELWDPSCADVDADGLCDDADACLAGDDRIDDDGDGTPEACDNCPGLDNPDQTDSDGDGIGDACDPCPSAGDALDSDGDGVCDSEDACADFDDAFDDDHDGLPNQCDSCPQDVDPGQEDEDGDGVGDACDPCPTAEAPDDADGDGVCDLVDAGGGGGGGGATQGCGGCDTGSAGPGWLLLALPLALRRRR
jgi:Synergist-CTERM protein sorting domain-containing protein